MMDNRIFNVNGRGLAMLRDALALAFIQAGHEDSPATCKGWKLTEDGLVLLWHMDPADANRFPVGLSAADVAKIVFDWLLSDEAKKVPCKGWDSDANHDGHNEPGWRVFVDDWGHVSGETEAICAVRPSWNWLGK